MFSIRPHLVGIVAFLLVSWIAPAYGQDEFKEHRTLAIGLHTATPPQALQEKVPYQRPWVYFVLPEGAGDVLGLKAGDFLYRVDDLEVWNTDQALKAMGKRKVGDRLTLTVQRGEQCLVLKGILLSPLKADQILAQLRQLAEAGTVEAQIFLGESLQTGTWSKKDEKEAVAWFRKAADKGNGLAQRWLGYMYVLGLGVAQDDREAMAWFRKAADQGIPRAQKNLARMYDEGRGVPQDDKQALAWIRKAAEQGEANAQGCLGDMYVLGKGVPQGGSGSRLRGGRSIPGGGQVGKEGDCRLRLRYSIQIQ